VSLTAGLGVVAFLGICFLIVMVFPGPPPEARAVFYSVTSDGQIVKTLRGGPTVVVTDLQDRPIERYQNADALRNLADGVVSEETDLEQASEDRPVALNARQYRDSHSLFVYLNDPDSFQATSWYYVGRLSLIAEYDKRSARLLGWLGPGGYTAGETPPEQRFEGELITSRFYLEPLVMPFPGAVYRVDLKNREVTKIFTAPNGESVVGAAQERWNPSLGVQSRFDVIATNKNVYVQTADGKALVTTPRDPEAAGYGYLATYRVFKAPTIATFVWYLPLITDPRNPPELATVFNSEGAATDRFVLPSLRPTASPIRWPSAIAGALPLPVTVPVMLEVLRGFGAAPEHDSLFTFANSPRAPREIRIAGWVIPALGSLLAAILIFTRARKYAFPQARLTLWTLIGFLLGPLGFALMLTLLEWPALESCPTCGRKRVVTRDHCEHCGAPFKSPATDGAEIFEHAVPRL
jgi:hypothetical protein